MEKETELKTRLAEFIQSIDDCCQVTAETRTKLFQTVFAFNAERRNKSPEIPKEFKCPLSKKLMKDPVIIASSQTFDGAAIVNWRKSGKRTCPHTNNFLTHDALTPNHLLRKLISKWCKSHRHPEPVELIVEEQPTKAGHTHFTSLHMKLSTMGPSEQIEAAKELCRLTNEAPVYRALYAEGFEFVTQLLNVLSLSESDSEIDPQLHEDIITILSNILIDERNKKVVAECDMCIPVLIQSLEAKKLEIRCKAAVAIHQLSSLDSNKELIGNSDVLKLLIELLKVKGSPKATQDAMKAISSLCGNDENVGRAVRLHAVFVVAEKFVDKVFVDELLPILARFSFHKQACEELESLKFVPVLLSIVKNNPSDESKENAILILHNVFENNRRMWKEMVRGAEENWGTIIQISESGTPRAKTILESLNKDTATSSSSTPQ